MSLRAPHRLCAPQAERVLATCMEWQFDAFALAKTTDGHPLSALSFFLFHRQGLIERFSIDPAVLTRLGSTTCTITKIYLTVQTGHRPGTPSLRRSSCCAMLSYESVGAVLHMLSKLALLLQ
jgi:hypothetical protein